MLKADPKTSRCLPGSAALRLCHRSSPYARIATLAAAFIGIHGTPNAAAANGRMPGANDVVFNAGNRAHLVARATFGIMQTFDAGATFSWICEQVIDISGVIADPPLGVMHDGSLVLLPPTGSALVSRDAGCSFTRLEGDPAGQRGVDLTADPSDPHRVLLLMSTLDAFDSEGYGIFRNELIDSRDDAVTFDRLATLPTNFEAETVEIAKSDPSRIYVSGTDSKNARLGIIERSEDGGQTWTRTSLALPAGSGSLFISGIAPDNADRLWVRIPARGDTLGILPARLMLSEDKGETFKLLAATDKAMFGFALSPDGTELAYGGPSDGLFVGPSDGSGPFEQKSDLGIRCLRWNENGLYACASEPRDPFSLGLSQDGGASFKPLYRMADTCPQTCDESTSYNRQCKAEWETTRPFIRAAPLMCAVPWTYPEPDEPLDAGIDDGTDQDASTDGNGKDAGDSGANSDPSSAPTPSAGCGCRVASSQGSLEGSVWGLLMVCVGLGLRRARKARGAWVHSERSRMS